MSSSSSALCLNRKPNFLVAQPPKAHRTSPPPSTTVLELHRSSVLAQIPYVDSPRRPESKSNLSFAR
ncbi:hypothetical protein COLO4_38152 [Corchorus olitorius]|uniref:Uncharacterized protein n=1 Tax=Corchorus olitorius TaxID=93759 RepID=A0A1R3FWP5_9ROSI|nr:hypothetical protein COLO4_38152 [Corchorus olitorius]